MTTLSLEASKKVFEIVGEYEAEEYWIKGEVVHGEEGEVDIRLGDTWNLYRYGKPDEWDMELTYDELKSGSDLHTLYLEKYAQLTYFPAPKFAELVRALPKIGEKMCWNSGFGRTGTCLIDVLYNMSIIYMNAPTEPEGMQAVEEYLLNLL